MEITVAVAADVAGFSLEPGAYEGAGGTFGARSEKMVLVTASGPEVLSQFEWGIV